MKTKGLSTPIILGIVLVVVIGAVGGAYLLLSNTSQKSGKLVVRDVHISPLEAKPGGTVTVSVNVKNVGNAEGSKVFQLSVAGKTITKSADLKPGETETLSFTVTKDQPGIYTANISGLSETIEVVEPAKVKKPSLEISVPEWVMSGERVRGRITSNGEPVENVKVSYRYEPFFSDECIENNSLVKTDENGKFLFKFKKPGDYELNVQKEGYKGKSEFLFESKDFDPSDWHIIKHDREKRTLESYKVNKNHLRINTYPPEVGKHSIRPNIHGKDNNFDPWDDYTVSFDYKFRRGSSGLGISIRQNPIGRYVVAISPWGRFQLWKCYPVENYTDQDNTKMQVILESVETPGEWENKWHNITIKTVGKSFEVYIDNKKELKYTDNFEGKIEGKVGPNPQPKPISQVEGRIKEPFLKGIFDFETHKELDVSIDNLVVKEFLKDQSTTTETIRVYPKGSEKIKIRGVKEKGLPYLRFGDGKTLGANWDFRDRSYWVNSDNFSITLSPRSASEKLIRSTIKNADYRGLKFYYTTHLWWEGEPVGSWNYVPPSDRDVFLKNATELALKEAKFAENNNVDMYAPIQNLHEFVPHQTAVKWYRSIVPKIKEVYDGKIIKGKNDLHQGVEKTKFDFSKFDYVSISTGPSGSYANYREKVQKLVTVGERWAEKYDNKGIIVYPVNGVSSENFVLSELKEGKTIGQAKANFNRVFFQETVGNIEGCFFDCQWFERQGGKLYSKMAGEGDLTHSTAWYWGYQGTEVAKLIRKYYSSQYKP